MSHPPASAERYYGFGVAWESREQLAGTMSQQLIDDVGTLLDRQGPTLERAIAARHLAGGDTTDVVDILLQIAQNADEEEWVSHAAGESLAEILYRRGQLDAAPLHDFTGAAYIGFDEAVARLQADQT